MSNQLLLNIALVVFIVLQIIDSYLVEKKYIKREDELSKLKKEFQSLKRSDSINIKNIHLQYDKNKAHRDTIWSLEQKVYDLVSKKYKTLIDLPLSFKKEDSEEFTLSWHNISPRGPYTKWGKNQERQAFCLVQDGGKDE